MITLELEAHERTGRNSELWVRSAVAIAFAVGMSAFFVWFIATHMTRYPN